MHKRGRSLAGCLGKWFIAEPITFQQFVPHHLSAFLRSLLNYCKPPEEPVGHYLRQPFWPRVSEAVEHAPEPSVGGEPVAGFIQSAIAEQTQNQIETPPAPLWLPPSPD